jgi:non-homologous end joining protein Ku
MEPGPHGPGDARSRPALYRIEVWSGALIARQYAWPEYVEQAPQVSTTVDGAMLGLLDQLVQSQLTQYDAAAFVDTRAKEIAALVAAASTQPQLGVVQSTPQPTVDTLMAALQASIAAQQQEAAA